MKIKGNGLRNMIIFINIVFYYHYITITISSATFQKSFVIYKIFHHMNCKFLSNEIIFVESYLHVSAFHALQDYDY